MVAVIRGKVSPNRLRGTEDQIEKASFPIDGKNEWAHLGGVGMPSSRITPGVPRGPLNVPDPPGQRIMCPPYRNPSIRLFIESVGVLICENGCLHPLSHWGKQNCLSACAMRRVLLSPMAAPLPSPPRPFGPVSDSALGGVFIRHRTTTPRPPNPARARAPRPGAADATCSRA